MRCFFGILAVSILGTPLGLPQIQTAPPRPFAQFDRTSPLWIDPVPAWYTGYTPQQYVVMDVDDQGVRHVAYIGGGACGNLCGVYYQYSLDGLTWTLPEFIPGTEDTGWGEAALAAGPNGRVYVVWAGALGTEITWSDDRGATWHVPVAVDPTATTALTREIFVDSRGAVHLAWPGYPDRYYYARSTPTEMGNPGGSTDPVFFPAQVVWFAPDDAGNGAPYLAVDLDGFVSMTWTRDGGVYYARSREGIQWGDPLRLEGVDPLMPFVTASPDGTVTILYQDRVGSRDHVFTLVSRDGVTFDGPFDQTPGQRGGNVPGRRALRSGPDGQIYAIWWQWWRGYGNYLNPTYVESLDYGRTFYRHEMIADAFEESFGGAVLAIAPDRTRCIMSGWLTYTQSRR